SDSVYRCLFFQAEDGIRDRNVTGVQTCALPILTEIERTKEADTPGEIPGRSCLQADRRKETSLSCGVHGSAAKKWRKIIMTLSMKEKKILYAFACPSHHNTVTRLKWLTALTVDPEAKRR